MDSIFYALVIVITIFLINQFIPSIGTQISSIFNNVTGSTKSSFRERLDTPIPAAAAPVIDETIKDAVQSNPAKYGGRSWNNYISNMELDDGTIESHDDFIKGIRVFTGTPSFTDVADDNRSDIFTNFIGLRRPEYIPIREGTRSLPEVDESVLLRNSNLRW